MSQRLAKPLPASQTALDILGRKHGFRVALPQYATADPMNYYVAFQCIHCLSVTNFSMMFWQTADILQMVKSYIRNHPAPKCLEAAQQAGCGHLCLRGPVGAGLEPKACCCCVGAGGRCGICRDA